MISNSEISGTKPHNSTAGWFWQNGLRNYDLFVKGRFQGCSVWFSSSSSLNEKTSGNSAKKSACMLFAALDMLRVSGGRGDQSILSNNMLSQHSATQRWNCHGPWLHGSKAQDTIWLSMNINAMLCPLGMEAERISWKTKHCCKKMQVCLARILSLNASYTPGMEWCYKVTTAAFPFQIWSVRKKETIGTKKIVYFEWSRKTVCCQ